MPTVRDRLPYLAAVAALLVACGGAQARDVPAHYRIVPEKSEIRILVYRAGLFAGLGHNHVVVARNLSGTAVIGATPAASTFEMAFPVACLDVDDPALRAEEGAGFETPLDAGAIAGTRRNMLGPKLLDAANHDTIRIESQSVLGEFPDVLVRVQVTVRGAAYDLELPVSINTLDGGLIAVGRARISHPAIGLRPFRAALGTLRVADELLLKYRITAALSPDSLSTDTSL